MTARFGDRANFAVEVGDKAFLDDVTRNVDIWIAGRSVCCDDNTVYVPSFVHLVSEDLQRVQRGIHLTPPFEARTPLAAHRRCKEDATDTCAPYWFMNWGETTDNLITYLFRFDELLVITAQFWREHMSAHDRQEVLHARLPQVELERILLGTIQHLSS